MPYKWAPNDGWTQQYTLEWHWVSCIVVSKQSQHIDKTNAKSKRSFYSLRCTTPSLLFFPKPLVPRLHTLLPYWGLREKFIIIKKDKDRSREKRVGLFQAKPLKCKKVGLFWGRMDSQVGWPPLGSLELSKQPLYLTWVTKAFGLIAQGLLTCYVQVVLTAEKQRYSPFLISPPQKYLLLSTSPQAFSCVFCLSLSVCFHQSQQILSAKLAKSGTESDGYFVTKAQSKHKRGKEWSYYLQGRGPGGIFWFSQQTVTNFFTFLILSLLGSQKKPPNI